MSDVTASGVPAKVAVPSPLSTQVVPLGRAPVSPSDGAGYPLVVTVNVATPPATNVVELALVTTGALPTMIVNDWVASGARPLEAVMVMTAVPVAVGVPAMVAVPLALSVKLIPSGRAPDSAIVAMGAPVVVTATEPGLPRVK